MSTVATQPSSERPGGFHESMRIAGEKVDTDARIDVHHPYDNRVIGSVPDDEAVEKAVIRTGAIARITL